MFRRKLHQSSNHNDLYQDCESTLKQLLDWQTKAKGVLNGDVSTLDVSPEILAGVVTSAKKQDILISSMVGSIEKMQQRGQGSVGPRRGRPPQPSCMRY